VTLHPQAVAALALWSEDLAVTDPGFDTSGVEQKRSQARAAAALEDKEPVVRVVDVSAGGVPCRLYVPTEAASHGVLVFLHGGGFVFGDVGTHDGHSRRLANRTGLAVLAVEYRLAPEHRYPAAVEDADRTLAWVRSPEAESLGLDDTRVSVVGDSAGGNLALVLSLRNPDLLAATVLVYPFLDPTCTSRSYVTETGGLTRGEAEWYWAQYAATPHDLDDPDLAPLRSEDVRLRRINEPVLVQIASEDVLADEDRELVRRLRDAGVRVEETTYDGMIHGFWRHPELFDDAGAALAELAAFLREHV
jgi:acetyl esterase